MSYKKLLFIGLLLPVAAQAGFTTAVDSILENTHKYAAIAAKTAREQTASVIKNTKEYSKIATEAAKKQVTHSIACLKDVQKNDPVLFYGAAFIATVGVVCLIKYLLTPKKPTLSTLPATIPVADKNDATAEDATSTQVTETVAEVATTSAPKATNRAVVKYEVPVYREVPIYRAAVPVYQPISYASSYTNTIVVPEPVKVSAPTVAAPVAPVVTAPIVTVVAPVVPVTSVPAVKSARYAPAFTNDFSDISFDLYRFTL